MTIFKVKKDQNRKSWLVPILSLVVVILVFILGFFIGRSGFEVAWEEGEVRYSIKGSLYPEEKELDFGLFWEVWGMLEERYVDKSIDEQDMFFGAIKGVVASLGDPATVFLTPEETETYEADRSGKLEGIGIVMVYMDSEIIITEVIKDSPAAEEGLLSGDVIVKVEGSDISGVSISEIARQIRGEQGTKVKISVLRDSENQEIEFEIERQEIYIESVEWEMLESDIALISIRRFTEDSYTDFTLLWDEVIREVSQENPSGIIIDLRDNGGGFLDGAVYIAGEFMDEGTVVLYEEERGGKEVARKVSRGGVFRELPLVLLVDSGTASAAEIFAGALQHHKRATVIGKSTFGKGSAQDVIKPSSWAGASIHITSQKWLLPDKRWITHDDPIYPDIEIDIGAVQIKRNEDPQLDKAIDEVI